MNEKTRAMLAAAFTVAPTGNVQEALANVVREMQAAGEPDEMIALMLADAIVDGLRHGNWPR